MIKKIKAEVHIQIDGDGMVSRILDPYITHVKYYDIMVKEKMRNNRYKWRVANQDEMNKPNTVPYYGVEFVFGSGSVMSLIAMVDCYGDIVSVAEVKGKISAIGKRTKDFRTSEKCPAIKKLVKENQTAMIMISEAIKVVSHVNP